MEMNTVTEVPVTRFQLGYENPQVLGRSPGMAEEALIAKVFHSAELDEVTGASADTYELYFSGSGIDLISPGGPRG